MNNYIETLATVYANTLYGGFQSYSKKRQEVIDKLNEYSPTTEEKTFELFVELFVYANYDLECDDRYGIYACNPEIPGDISEHPHYESMVEQMEEDFAYEVILPTLNKTLATT